MELPETQNSINPNRYESAMRSLLEMTGVMQGGQWEVALELYTAAKRNWEVLRKNQDFRSGPFFFFYSL